MAKRASSAAIDAHEAADAPAPGIDPVDLLDDGAEDDGGGFEKLLANLMSGGGAPQGRGNAAPGVDPMNMFMMFMMQQQREARAEKASLMKLAVAFLPGLLNKGPDPLMMEVLRSALSGKNQEEFTRSMMDMQRAQAENSMKMMQETVASNARMRDDATKETIEAIKSSYEQRADAAAPAASPAMEIFREIRAMAEPILAKKFGTEVPAAPPTENRSLPAPSAAPENPASKKERIPFVLRVLKTIHENPQLTAADKRAFRARLSIVIMDVPDLATAVLNEDENAIALMCKEYVLADADILAWITRPGTSEWLQDYLNKQIAPLLDSFVEGEEPAPAGEADDADDGDEIPPEQVVQRAPVNGAQAHTK